MSFNLNDYEDVAHRLDRFFEKYPDGSIQSEILEHTADRVTVQAFAFRTPNDEAPGVGHSSLTIPGTTPYTRGSELENAETSARGRALVALGFGTKASKDEIQAKSGSAGVSPSFPRPDDGAATVAEPAGSPDAAPSPTHTAIQKAQAAQAEHKPVRPDLPVFNEQTGRWSAVTFVSSVDGPNDRGFYDIHVVLDGEPRQLGTKKTELAKTAHELIQSSCRVEWTEKVNGRYTNRYLHSIDAMLPDEVLALAGRIPTDEIPFAPAVW